MAEIVPTILTPDFEEFSKKIALLKGVTDRVQIDFIDGNFVKNKTIDFEAMKNADLDNLKIDLHLMVKEPVDWITRSLEILPDRIIGQVEMMNNPLEYINKVVEIGVQVGIALDLDTPVSVVPEEIYQSVDLILILAAKAGQSGQEFQPKALEKIKAVKQIVGNLVKIGVDCGLNDETIKSSFEAGASVFYITHSFWQSDQTELLLKRYNELVKIVS